MTEFHPILQDYQYFILPIFLASGNSQRGHQLSAIEPCSAGPDR
jgi:hypothetical protein